MTTKAHVYELVDRLDADGLDVERLDEDQLEALEIELSSILLRFGRKDEQAAEVEAVAEETPDERPYDPLGKVIGMHASNDGVTDVSGNIHKHVADAIKHR